MSDKVYINSIEDIKKYKQNLQNTVWLQILNINYAKIANDLKDLPKVETLNIGNSRVNSVKILPNAPNAKLLGLEGNKLSNVKNLTQKMPNIEELFLDNNQLTSLQGLESLSKLNYLDVGYNQLKTLTGLPKKINCDYMNFDDNKLTSFEGMPKEINASCTISLGGNSISSLKGLTKGNFRAVIGNMRSVDIDEFNIPDYQKNLIEKCDDEIRNSNSKTPLSRIPNCQKLLTETDKSN